METFEPDYTNLLSVLQNRRPRRLPLYEHHIDPPFMAKVLNRPVEQPDRGDFSDLVEYYRTVCWFWKSMTYDGVDYEAAVCEILPDHGALMGGRPGPVQDRSDFERYPFDDLPRIFIDTYDPHFRALREAMPAGMKAFGGCGYGLFEACCDLVGYEYLCIMQFEDPALFADLFRRVGDLYVELWDLVIERYADLFVFFRMGDDLGFKTATLLAPDTMREVLFPQYRRIVERIHRSGRKFLLHSCGNIFAVMEDLVSLGIDAKHSNEDEIAPFDEWIERYGSRIGLFGGIDVNTLCLGEYDAIYNKVLTDGHRFRNAASGYGLGSGNSIAEYVPVEGYLAMIDAVKRLRSEE